jgi:Fe2+ or Zn2+ uptake regulation protein
MKALNDLAEAENRLEEYASANGMRMSVERKFILRHICQQKHPVTSAELERAAKEANISRATVYNTLRLLVSARIVQQVPQLEGVRRVEYRLAGARQNRMEMRCTRCGRLVKIKDTAISDLIAAKRYSNFNFSHYTLCVYGECKLCRRRTGHKQTDKNKV